MLGGVQAASRRAPRGATADGGSLDPACDALVVGGGQSSRSAGQIKETVMSLLVAPLTIQLATEIRPLIARIRRHDRSLADQLVRAASSVALNVAEAEYSDPGNKRARLFTAAGSASETRAALRLGVAWGYFAAAEAEGALALAERVIAMLWRLTRG